MKISKHIFCYTAFIGLITLMGCADVIDKSILPDGMQKVTTRSLNTSDFYWYNGERVGLNKMNEKKFILFKAADEQALLGQITKGRSTSLHAQDVVLSSQIVGKQSRSIEPLKWAVIEDSDLSNANSDILYEAPCFTTEQGKEVTLGHLFYVKLKAEGDIAELKKNAFQNNVEILGNNAYMPLWYTLSCTKKSTGNALELANKFLETGLFESCQPDLICDDDIACVNDPLFSSQWALNNTGQNGGTIGVDINYCNARSITQGDNNIIVAVLDHGIQLNHPDLNIYSKSYDTESGTSPSRVLGDHGTACAGIIAARTNNSLGVAGIAPNCPLMSISNSLAASPDSRQKRADGFNYAWQNGASVISNSWSSSIQYDMIDDAMRLALTKGRNGLGCVVAFSAGNANGSVSYPARAIADIIVVGAMSPCGQRKSPSSCDREPWGSNYGTELDIMAPGVFITTTDRTGYDGYSSGDYTYGFNGTSSACPHVAGVAALVLSVNPELTQRQVATILEKSAKKIGGYAYSNVANRTNGTWHNEMGYGLVDAFAAVSRSSSEIVLFNDKTVSSSQTIAGGFIKSQNVTVTNGAKLKFVGSESTTINKTFTVNGGSQFEMSNN